MFPLTTTIQKEITKYLTSTVQLFLVPASVFQNQLCMLSCQWDGAYKNYLAANQKEYPINCWQVSFLIIHVVLNHMSDAVNSNNNNVLNASLNKNISFLLKKYISIWLMMNKSICFCGVICGILEYTKIF